jgi:hypothetical protein
MREDDVRFGAWETASRGLAVELTLESGAVEEALALGLAELSRCEANGMGKQARALSLAIAAAEAQLGRHDDARRRVEAVLAAQTALGVTGLQLGRSYEAAARVAISQKDRDAFERFAALAREQYRLGQSSVLGALYERLMDQARQSGISEASPGALVSRSREVSTQLSAGLTSLLAGCDSARERAERALGLLCDGDPPTRGHLLLLTGRGLSLVASNLPYGSASEIVAIASDCIDRESHTDDMETSALSTIQEDGATEYRDAEGNAYEVVLLGTMISGVFEVGGAALLVKGPKPRAPKLASLAGAIARALIDTGDAVTVAAS